MNQEEGCLQGSPYSTPHPQQPPWVCLITKGSLSPCLGDTPPPTRDTLVSVPLCCVPSPPSTETGEPCLSFCSLDCKLRTVWSSLLSSFLSLLTTPRLHVCSGQGRCSLHTADLNMNLSPAVFHTFVLSLLAPGRPRVPFLPSWQLLLGLSRFFLAPHTPTCLLCHLHPHSPVKASSFMDF